MGEPEVNLEKIGRDFLQTEVVDRMFGGNAAAAARAMGYSKPSLNRVLSGDTGLGRLQDWSERMERIGVFPPRMFGGGLFGSVAAQVASLVDKLDEREQEALLAYVATRVQAQQEARGLPPEAKRLVEMWGSMPSERRESLLLTAEAFSGS